MEQRPCSSGGDDGDGDDGVDGDAMGLLWHRNLARMLAGCNAAGLRAITLS